MIQIHLQSNNGNLAKAFPELVRLCLKYTTRGDHDRQLKILTRRHGLDGAPINTLEELGAVYNISRQRIEQIQSKAENRICQLLDGSLKRRGWDICPSLRAAAADLKNDLAAAGPALTRTRFQSVVRKRCGNGVKGHWFSLFAQMLGYCRLVPSGEVQVADLNELWLMQGAVPQTSIDQLFRELNLLGQSPEGKPLTRVLAALRRSGHSHIDEALLRCTVSAMPRLQITRSGRVRVRVEWLRSAADQSWHVLAREGKTLSRDEIARRVNAVRVGKRKLDAMSVNSIATQMSGDDRFVCSGKSGVWGLKAWGTVEELTIVEAMEKALHAAGRPLTLKALIDKTRNLRPDASPKSIQSYVNQRPERFVRAGRGKIALAVWNLNLPTGNLGSKVRCSTEDFLSAIELVRAGRETLPLKELIDGVAGWTGQADPTIRLRLRDLNGIRIEDLPGQRGKQIRFSGHPVQAPAESGPTQRELIQKTIRRVLDDSEIVFERKKDLYEEVNRQLPCKRPTFYRYFSEMRTG